MIRVYNIVWDLECDGVTVEENLPSEMTLPFSLEGLDDPEYEIADALSNATGFCVYEYEYETF